ncbi:hypothetical protein DPMN_160057 [Dreissena polymorpha]|uniref:THAP-type domain-containing protein n=1 Tax=Dreissena polymorpha TaxID=45954 RepID=A0A9D4EM42_DREPO|nr:hypothetical protein DPMN_160057 [Dreissena polymorpha]
MCACEPPFRLYPFPTRTTNPEARDKWLHIVGRRVGNKTWSPSKDCRVSSRHFRDGKPTALNSLPCLDIGYADAECRVQRMSRFEATKPKRQMKVKSVVLKEILVEITDDPIVEEIPAPTPKPVPWIFVLFVMFLALLQHCRNQTKQIKKLKKEDFSLTASLFELKNNRFTVTILSRMMKM